MKISKIFLLLLVAAIAFSACETLPKQEVTYSPTFPVSGEYLVRVNYASKLNGADSVAASASIFAMRTYNTSSNTKDTVWVKLGASSAAYKFGLLGKSSCNPTAATFSVAGGNNLVYSKSFTILEGKVLLGKAKVPSKSVCDSIYVRFTTANDPTKIYVVKGHRRTGFLEDENI